MSGLEMIVAALEESDMRFRYGAVVALLDELW